MLLAALVGQLACYVKTHQNYDSSFELSADVGQGKSTYTDYDLERLLMRQLNG